MTLTRLLLTFAVALALGTAARAQSVALTEAGLDRGSCFRIELSMKLKGKIKVQQDGQPKEFPHEATARHVYAERVLKAHDGLADVAARLYETAGGEITFNGQGSKRSLRGERAFMVAHRVKDQRVVYSPRGGLTREEMELTEHFDTLFVGGLVPGKDVAVGDSWKLATPVAVALCDLDGVTEHDLTCKLEEIKDGVATVSVTGTASGIGLGAQVKTLVTARYQFDTAAKRVVGVEWKQSDERQQGPISPALSADVTITLRRTPADPPPALSDLALTPIDPEKAPPAHLTNLQYRDPAGRYEFQHGRDWHVVSPEDGPQMVLRLMDRGDFIAQATLTPWKKADPKALPSPDDFQKLVGEIPGWDEDQVLEKPAKMDGVANGYTVYRYTASGSLDGVKAVQAFYLVVGPLGEQLIATFSVVPTQVQKLGARDVELVRAIAFPSNVVQTKSE